jgi:hypothetical protein
MKLIERIENLPKVTDYNYKRYAPHFEQMQKHLIESGSLLLIGSFICFTLIYWILSSEKNISSYVSLLFGGVVGTLTTLSGVYRPTQAGNRFALPKVLTDYEKKLHVVILKFRKKWLMYATPIPYFLWILVKLSEKELSLFGSIEATFYLALLAFILTSGLSLGSMYWQVFWSLAREIKNNQEK